MNAFKYAEPAGDISIKSMIEAAKYVSGIDGLSPVFYCHNGKWRADYYYYDPRNDSNCYVPLEGDDLANWTTALMMARNAIDT